MTAYYIIPRDKKRMTHVEYASNIFELGEIVEAYYKAGWELIQMCEEGGYTLVFKRSERV